MKIIKSFLLIALLGVIYSVSAQSKQESLNEVLENYSKENAFNGTALVYYKGELFLSKGYGYQDKEKNKQNSPSTIFQLGSITKQFTAAVILKLEEQGKLKLSDPLTLYFTDYPNGNRITIHHLLSHTSGIFNYTDDEKFLKAAADQPISQNDMLSLFMKKPLQFEPGTEMKYSNSNYILLGYIIEKITKMPYEEVVNDYILKPLKMTHSGFDFAGLMSADKATGYLYVKPNAESKARSVHSTVSYAAGAMYADTQDLLKWHLALLDNKTIRSASKLKAFTPNKNNFGYGWVADTVFGKKGVYHNGSIFGFTSNIYRIEEDNTCIILLNNIGNSKIDQITKDLLAVLYDRKIKKDDDKKEISITPEILNGYLSTFEFSPQFKMKIFVEDHKLYAQRLGEQDYTLIYPFAENQFYAKSKDAVLLFSKANSNEFNQLTLSQGGKTMLGTKINVIQRWGIAGSAMTAGWDGPDVKLIPDASRQNRWIIEHVKLLDGEIKFRLDDDWSSNYGAGNPSDTTLMPNGENIKVVSGIFDIILDLSNPQNPKYSITKSKL